MGTSFSLLQIKLSKELYIITIEGIIKGLCNYYNWLISYDIYFSRLNFQLLKVPDLFSALTINSVIRST